MPSSRAASATGGGNSFRPLPFGRSGRVTTSCGECELAATRRKTATANSDVPMKTVRTPPTIKGSVPVRDEGDRPLDVRPPLLSGCYLGCQFVLVHVGAAFDVEALRFFVELFACLRVRELDRVGS